MNMEENNIEESVDHKDIFQKACLIQVSSSVWMGSRMLAQEVMEQIGQSEWLRGRKYLVNPELLGPIRTAIHQARNEVGRHALPFPITSLSLIPKESLGPVDEALQGYETRYWERVGDFIAQYDYAREEAERVLGDLFNETDYPQDIAKKFKFEWRFLTIDLPKKSRILTPEIYKREKEKFEQLMAETRDMATEALASELGNIVENLIERLNGNGNGKNKAINSAMLNKMRDFLDAFNTRNVFDDYKLNQVVEQANTALMGISAYGLKYNDVLKQRIANSMGDIKETVDNILVDLPRRKIQLAA
jgi:hypothetical protein